MIMEPVAHDRSAIIHAVRTPLGFFALCILAIEVLLLALSARAAGYDFTVLVVGALIGLFVLLFLFNRAMSTGALSDKSPQPGISFSGLSTNDLRLLHALHNRSGVPAGNLETYLQNPEVDFKQRMVRLEQRGFIITKTYGDQSYIEATQPVHEFFRLVERMQQMATRNP